METNVVNENNPGAQQPPINPAPPQYYAPQQQPLAKKPPLNFDKTDSLFAGIAIITGFLFFECIFFGGLGFGVPLFFIAAYAGVLLYGLKSKSMDIKKGAPLFIPIVLLLFCFVLFDNTVLGILDIGFLFFLSVLQFMTMFGVRDYEKLSKGVVFDFIGGFLGRPLMNLDKLFVITAKGTKDEKGKRLVWRIMLGVVICVPLLAVILSLLSSADLAFEGVLKKISDFIGMSIWEYFGKFILGCMAAVPLFGAIFAFRYKLGKGAVKIPAVAGNVDDVVAYTVLTIVNAVYLFFLFVQFNYMFLAFRGKLPGGFIYSEYARRGFFELVAIAAINLGISIVFYLFTRRKEGRISKGLKGCLLALACMTLVIIASAVSKMVMYMQVYGLTQLRVYTSWFMILLAVVFLLAVIKIISRKFNAVKIICVFFTVWFLALNYAGVDALIVRYNISKSEMDKSVVLDVNMFRSLSDSMVPYAVELLNGETETGKPSFDVIMAKYTLKNDLADRYNRLAEANWQAFNLSSYQAKKALEKNKDTFRINFDGNYLRAASGQDKDMLLRFIPKMEKFQSCAWYLDLVREKEFNWNGEYRFYGYAILSPAYYDQITSNFVWDELDIPFTGIAYFENLPDSVKLYASSGYETAMNENGTVNFVLDKTSKKLYFNVSKNYLYPNDEYISRMD